MIKHSNLLFSDINLFNKKLYKYLHWYNFKIVHQRFNNKITPFEQQLQPTNYHIITTQISNRNFPVCIWRTKILSFGLY